MPLALHNANFYLGVFTIGQGRREGHLGKQSSTQGCCLGAMLQNIGVNHRNDISVDNASLLCHWRRTSLALSNHVYEKINPVNLTGWGGFHTLRDVSHSA